jgi:hypothetical protein
MTGRTQPKSDKLTQVILLESMVKVSASGFSSIPNRMVMPTWISCRPGPMQTYVQRVTMADEAMRHRLSKQVT